MVAHHRIDAIHRDLAMEIFLKSMTCGVVHQLAATAICDVSHLTGDVAEIEVHIGDHWSMVFGCGDHRLQSNTCDVNDVIDISLQRNKLSPSHDQSCSGFGSLIHDEIF